ncbi:PREDICTED: mucin-1 [Chrysochloris asiatica]|uniref:Mucin-1 n=1 Tax=Chrysochloris asiatica TaxID=185453 RepID=A0A9B0TI43_CHRAS|nr:PREDICTED: mucin-1 [Chrysochloris asiatica]
MAPCIQAPFFLLLLLTAFAGNFTTFAQSSNTDTHLTQSSPTSIPMKPASSIGSDPSPAASPTSIGTSVLTTSSHNTTAAPFHDDGNSISTTTTRPAFNSSLEDPRTNYYQELQKNISKLFLQIYQQENFMGSSIYKFRPGSVVVESTLAFRKGTTDANSVETQFAHSEAEGAIYNLNISRVNVKEVTYSSSAPSESGVPGWGIALLVLVCVLVALAIVYLIALAVCQCRQKSCGQLDIFLSRDAYHPMSEYPTYQTHGRYVPPGSTKPNPYEEVIAGNGGSNLSFTNLTTTSSADL